MTTTTDFPALWPYHLKKGNSQTPAEGACLMSAANWFAHGVVGDRPPCACPVIREYAIGINDRMPEDTRDRLLRPFIFRVVGNRDRAAEPARRHHIVLETARRVIPLAFAVRWPALAADARALSGRRLVR